MNKKGLPRAKPRGFTITELLIVIAIIGILASIILVATMSTRTNARNTRRKADLTAMKSALESYYQVRGSYPSTNAGWCGEPSSNYDTTGEGCDHNVSLYGASSYILNLVPQYLIQLPADPNRNAAKKCANSGERTYRYRSNGQAYKLQAWCTPEGTLSISDPFYDPSSASNSWQVSSDSTSRGW